MHRYSLRVSFLEIYQENVRDLLAPNNTKEIFIRENKSGTISLAGVHEQVIHTKEEMLRYLD